MGQVQVGEGYFQEVRIKEGYESVPTLWSEADIASLIEKLRETTLNFSVDRSKFARLLQLSTACDALVTKWAEDFSRNRAGNAVDGLEFFSAAIAISSSIRLYQKISLLHSLFDLDRTGILRKDEFTIFLKSLTFGLSRMLSGLPPPIPAQALGPISTEYCNMLPTKTVSQQDFFTWVTEMHHSLPYLSILSRLGTAVFVLGSNRRRQLGLNFDKYIQQTPTPMLSFEGISISSIASSESHCLFLTTEGHVWSCGSGFCGILGHGDVSSKTQPQLLESLSHVRVVDVSVGVRHSVAVSDKGQVFTWGAADLGQLGHGSLEDRDVHECAYDPKTGGEFAYVSRPTVVMALFGKKIFVKKVSCCNFTTVALTNQDMVYTWGNNTDGQCGQGQRCPDHTLVYLDAHVHRSAMQIISLPRLLQSGLCRFKSISAGGYHVLALDGQSRLWTWGQGLWGKLGHGDQNSVYEPRMVETLKHHICQAVAAGESHSLCLCALFRLTVTDMSSTRAAPFKPFALLASPVGRADRYMTVRKKRITPPNTDLQLNAFSSARLLQCGLPFSFHPTEPIFDTQYTASDVQDSIILVSRSLWEGDWLKLSVTAYDFSIKMSSEGVKLSPTQPLRGALAFFSTGLSIEVCTNKICVYELDCRLALTPQEMPRVISDIASQCQHASALACICVLPENIPEFNVAIPPGTCRIPVGVMNYKHGKELKKHDTHSGVQAALVSIAEDNFFKWLRRILDARPKGIIISQSSWRPDLELLDLPEGMFDLGTIDIPIALVSYEAGEELRNALLVDQQLCLTMEIQESGGIYAWGNNSYGQLGLGGIENRNFLTYSQNSLTDEENTFVDRPVYVPHLHEHGVIGITCGAAHAVAVTSQGEAYTWGAGDSLGIQVHGIYVPVCVERLTKHVRAKAAFAGGHHSFVVADMPFKSVVSDIV